MEYKFTVANFEEEVLNNDKLVLVDFYADWCGPCKMMAPVVESLANEFEGKLKVGKCNIDENMALAQKYGVLSIPTFIVFEGGKIKNTMIGAVGADEFKQKIQELI